MTDVVLQPSMQAMCPKKFLLGVAALVFSYAPHLHAQDVSVTPLAWVNEKFAGDELPVVNQALRPDFPEELRNTTDYGYVILGIYLDEKGEHRTHNRIYSLPEYERVVTHEFDRWILKPGRRAGQPIDTVTRCVVIFNPASADPKKPDAAPRLLDVAVAVDPLRRAKNGERGSPPETVWAMIKVDASGRLTVKDAPPQLGEVFTESLKKWKFAPARRNGQAVSADVRVPFVVVPEDHMAAGATIPPRIMHQADPVYPRQLRTSGLRGEVVLNLSIDERGAVTKATVVRSLNPAFDQPALDAVRFWTFEPARRDGVPVAVPLQVTMNFGHSGLSGGGESGVTVENKGDQLKLPPEFRYDVAPKPRGIMRPVYPYELLRDDVRGKARVRFALSANGKVMFAAVVSADRPEFGAALQAAIEGFDFEPALKDGHPTQALLAMDQNFSTFDQEGLVTREDRKLLALELKHPERISTPMGLDQKFRATTTRAPAFPVSLFGKVAKGQAVVEFLVDAAGRARLPRIVSATDPAFGWSALQAIAEWRFVPPRRGGKEEIVRARVPFDFNGPVAEARKP